MKIYITHYVFIVLNLSVIASCTAEPARDSSPLIPEVNPMDDVVHEEKDTLITPDTIVDVPITALAPRTPNPDPNPIIYPAYPIKMQPSRPNPPDELRSREIHESLNAEIVDFPEIDASFPGGILTLNKFITDNIQYPEIQVAYQEQVFVSFIVEKDGSITTIKVARGITPELNNEALRVIRKMPNWIPAENKGKPVRSRVLLPFRFELH